MTTFHFRLTLTADAELGTGLGGEIVNDFVPRDPEGFPVIPASHLKGLMRATLREIATYRATDWGLAFPDKGNWPDPLLEAVFGSFDQSEPNESTGFFVADARLNRTASNVKQDASGDSFTAESDEEIVDNETWSHLVTRTKVGEFGVAAAQSLRTTEAMLKGSVFEGTVTHTYKRNSIQEIAIRLALLSIPAVGGSRNRGGHCVIEFFTSERAEPGDLLRQLDDAIKSKRYHTISRENNKDGGKRLAHISQLSQQTTLIELLFVADAPVCCPERPDRSNVIVSGFSIPASAVQGIVLNHVNERDSKLADLLFESPGFRCWPLNPCIHPADRQFQRVKDRTEFAFDELPRSIRVSLSHRTAKFSTREDYGPDWFFDEAFFAAPCAWPENPDNAPLKASDGVLLFSNDRSDESGIASPRLWRAQDMPRHLSTHGVLGDGRNLFSVDAMAPLVWRGMFAVPDNVVDQLVASLNEFPQIAIGKRKSVRGSGKLIARRVNELKQIFRPADQQDRTVLVLQSPALIPQGEYDGKHGDEILHILASQWTARHGLPRLAGPRDCWAMVGIRFGWTRHGHKFPGGEPLQKAARVILPGSVFSLKGKPDTDRLHIAILSGFFGDADQGDAGRIRGFGAVAVHPGPAVELYRGRRTTCVLPRSRLFGPMQIIEQIEQEGAIPSASQIRAVQHRIDAKQDDPLKAARAYLSAQFSRNAAIQFRWERIVDHVERLLREYPVDVATDALDILADIATARENDERYQNR